MEILDNFILDTVDIIVVGAGHAGCEAALAGARLGKKVALLAMTLESIADMPCNPNIGGTGKGHLVREIDALGGQMGLTIDESFLQSKMLNTSKGPAVHSLRAQADKRLYHDQMKKTLEAQENLFLYELEVTELLLEGNKIQGIKSHTGSVILAEKVILATGTYLDGMILMGESVYSSGPSNRKPSISLAKYLRELNLPFMRFKTGSPARIHRRSIDFDQTIVEAGDEKVIPFSFLNQDKEYDFEQLNCYLTRTTLKTKEIILENLHRSPMYSGEKKGVGPRYCPSIEDKVVRFPDHDTHQAFIEPEGFETDEMYISGISSTLPVDVQLDLYHSIVGLEEAEIMRPAYGIEYDTLDARILKRTLEHRDYPGLYFAGQINGTSGYEEAAAQGLIAGINASLDLDGQEAFILDRSEAYIGVMIDDLVTKGTDEPYRMMTSRAEYRLTLRQDNADLRLTRKAYDIGLASEERMEKMLHKKDTVKSEIERLQKVVITPTKETNKKLEELGTKAIRTGMNLEEMIRRPELDYEKLEVFDPERPKISLDIINQINIQIKYQGYIDKQNQQIERFQNLEKKSIQHIEDFSVVKGLSNEALQKLNEIQPESIGQASRIPGVTPADTNVLLVHLEVEKRNHA